MRRTPALATARAPARRLFVAKMGKSLERRSALQSSSRRSRRAHRASAATRRRPMASTRSSALRTAGTTQSPRNRAEHRRTSSAVSRRGGQSGARAHAPAQGGRVRPRVALAANNCIVVQRRSNDSDLSWVNLGVANSTRSLRTGDTRKGAAPTWSHNSNTNAYVCRRRRSWPGPLDNGSAKECLLEKCVREPRGSTATPRSPRASDAKPKSRGLARQSAGQHSNRIGKRLNMYNQPQAEVFAVCNFRESGGTATRLADEDPPACAREKSPGVTNSWAEVGAASVPPAAAAARYLLVVFQLGEATRDTRVIAGPRTEPYRATVELTRGGGQKPHTT